MKHLKTFGLSAVAVALMALVGAGGASATVLTGAGGDLKVGSVFDFSLKSGTSSIWVTTSGDTMKTCTTSTLKGKITATGGATSTTTGNIEALTWGNCTFPATTVTLGKLEFHHIAGTTNATVTADAGIALTTNTVFFGSCSYVALTGTDLGVLTGGNPATWDVNAVMVKYSGSAFACPETVKWTATYVSTEPAGPLHAEAS